MGIFTGQFRHGPRDTQDAPRATAEDMEALRRNGGVCACSDCQNYGHYGRVVMRF